MATTDATAIPIKNQAYRVTFPIFDNDGDLVTGAAALDSEVSKDAGTFADVSPGEATEIGTSGMYYLDLTATEMNADTVTIIVKTTTTDAKTTPIVLYPAENGDIPVNVEQWTGTAVATPDTNGYPVVTVKDGTGQGELNITSGATDANVTSMAAGTVTAAAIATGAIDADAVATDAITAAKIADDAIDPAALTGPLRAVLYAGPRGPGVYLDDAAANTNTTLGTDGTADNPVSTLAAASTLVTSLGIKRLYLQNDSAITLTAGLTDYEVVGIGTPDGNSVALASQDISGAAFYNVTVSGVQTGSGRALFEDCLFGTATLHLIARRCGLTDAISTGLTFSNNDDNVMDSCFSIVPGNSTPILTCSAANLDLSIRHYSGGLEIDSSNATATASIELDGQLIFAATCSTSTAVSIRGNATITDNTGGMAALTDGARFDNSRVAQATDLATVDGIVDDILVDTGITLPSTLTTIEGKVDTVDTVVDSILVDTGTTLDGKINTIDTNVDSILTDTGTTLPTTLTTIEGKVDTVDTVVDSILVDTAALTAAGADPTAIPAVTATMMEKVDFICAMLRNKITQTATTLTLRNNADGANIGTATVSDDGTTATRGLIS